MRDDLGHLLSYHHPFMALAQETCLSPLPWLDSLGCGAGTGLHVGPGTSCGSDLVEVHIQFPRLRLDSLAGWGPMLSEVAESRRAGSQRAGSQNASHVGRSSRGGRVFMDSCCDEFSYLLLHLGEILCYVVFPTLGFPRGIRAL